MRLSPPHTYRRCLIRRTLVRLCCDLVSVRFSQLQPLRFLLNDFLQSFDVSVLFPVWLAVGVGGCGGDEVGVLLVSSANSGRCCKSRLAEKLEIYQLDFCVCEKRRISLPDICI